MLFGGKLYCHDDVEGGPFWEADEDEARRLNQGTVGVFHTVNAFRGPRRIANLEKILSWAIDMDSEPKRTQIERLRTSPLRPSCIVETARGFHAYWSAIDASEGEWEAIVRDRLVPHFRADPNARDLARVLRTPGFRHLKDPTKPFLVRVVHKTSAAYTEAQMLRSFRAAPVILAPEKPAIAERAKVLGLQLSRPKPITAHPDSDEFFTKLYGADQGALLAVLSGRPEVNYDQITFRQNSNGTMQIHVNGKSTSCWIDGNGRIGSSDKGGPSVVEWMEWYGRTKGEALKVIKGIFPELVG